MEEEQFNLNNCLAVTHLLQHTLRTFCVHRHSQWLYAVFWRILPRNYPPPKWDSQAGGASRGNRRNWILVWEDGFCNFGASTPDINAGEGRRSSVYGNGRWGYEHCDQGLQPELFFKMSHEIYNYGEGLIGKVAADRGHKWIYKERNDEEINFYSVWQNSADSHPRTWEAQFECGIKTIALIAVREGVIQLGSVHKVVEDLNYIMLLRKKFSYIDSIPGVLLPHPSSTPCPFKIDSYGEPSWPYSSGFTQSSDRIQDHFSHEPMIKNITPSMSSLEALLSKLPSVVPMCFEAQTQGFSTSKDVEFLGVEKEECEAEDAEGADEMSTRHGSMPPYQHHRYACSYDHVG